MQKYPSDWNTRRKKVYKRDNYTCQRCGAKGGPHGNVEIHAHHRIPISQGGGHELSNLVSVCRSCHEDIHGHPVGGARKSKTNTRSTQFFPQWANPPYNLRHKNFSENSKIYVDYLITATNVHEASKTVANSADRLFNDLELINEDSYNYTTDQDAYNSLERNLESYKKKLSILDEEVDHFHSISESMPEKPSACRRFERRMLRTTEQFNEIDRLSEKVLSLEGACSIDVTYNELEGKFEYIRYFAKDLGKYADLAKDPEIKRDFNDEQDFERYILTVAHATKDLSDFVEKITSITIKSNKLSKAALFGDGIDRQIRDDIRRETSDTEKELQKHRSKLFNVLEVSEELDIDHIQILRMEKQLLEFADLISEFLEISREIHSMENWNPIAEIHTELTEIHRDLSHEFRNVKQYERLGKELSRYIERDQSVKNRENKNETADEVYVDFSTHIKHWVASIVLIGLSRLSIPVLGWFGVFLLYISVTYFLIASYLLLSMYDNT